MKIEITAKSVNEAIDEALEKLNVAIDEIEYEVIQEPSKGFFGLGTKNAIVKVWKTGDDEKSEAAAASEVIQEPVKKAPVKEAPKAKETPAVKPEPEKVADKATVFEFDSKNKTFNEVTPKEKPVNVVDPTDKAIAFLKEVFAAMNMEVSIDAQFVDNKQLNVNLSGNEMGVIIGKRGQTLDSLQYLLNLVINKGDAAYVSINLDTEHYREKRKETLERLAFNLAKKAKHLRKNVVLEPMNPFERRIIHYTLQNDRYVTTYSEGTEPYRYVVIAPKATYSHRTRENEKREVM